MIVNFNYLKLFILEINFNPKFMNLSTTKSKNLNLMKTTIVFSLLVVFSAFSQNKQKDKNIFTAYSKYTGLPREVAYVHLNKTKYIKGENIGFSAYIIDKNSRLPSLRTTNLYCTISDKNEKVIKSKLIKVENGVSSGFFIIDSLFESGEYQFKAYTNWMKNFNEPNFYFQKIQIIDPKNQPYIEYKSLLTNIDAQFLPEGGHLIANTINTVGVIIKDSLGFGFPFVKGEIINSNDSILNTFRVNKLGIGKFTFLPKTNTSYKIKLSYQNRIKTFNLQIPKAKGINLSLNRNRNRNNLNLTFRTNSATIESIRDEKFTLTIHNGNRIKTYTITFNNKTEINLLIKQENLFSGINIVTLFDNKNNPILERIFFNYDGINFIKSANTIVKRERDSLFIELYYNDLKSSKHNNLSVSILPSKTLSYNHHHNISSYMLLQPYLKGVIENGSYYFTDITQIKKEALDNLLLTQGWSSYNWFTIFNNPPTYSYNFETGITIKTNLNNKKYNKFYFYALSNKTESFITELPKGDSSFEVNGIFPFNKNLIRISGINEDGQFKIPSLYLQFTPSKIPNIFINKKTLGLKELTHTRNSNNTFINDAFGEDYEQLDEVTVTTNTSTTRIETLKSMDFGKVELFNDNMRNLYRKFPEYIRSKGFDAWREPGTTNFTVRSRISTSFSVDPIALIFLNDMIITDHSYFLDFNMDIVDYVEISRHGVGYGIRGAGGIIKIYTDPKKLNSLNIKTRHKNYKVPLTFSRSNKIFYTPRYKTYKNQFYKEYGVIGWLPNCTINDKGMLKISTIDTGLAEIKLFIEGLTDNGSFISEVKTINLNNTD